MRDHFSALQPKSTTDVGIQESGRKLGVAAKGL